MQMYASPKKAELMGISRKVGNSSIAVKRESVENLYTRAIDKDGQQKATKGQKEGPPGNNNFQEICPSPSYYQTI